MKKMLRAFILLAVLSFLSAACGNACGGSKAGVAAYVPAAAAISGVVYARAGDMQVFQGETPENATPSQRMYSSIFRHVDFSQLGMRPEAYADYAPKDMGFFFDDSLLVFIAQSDDPEATVKMMHDATVESTSSESAAGLVIEESKLEEADGITTYGYRFSMREGEDASLAYSYAVSAHDKYFVSAMEFSLAGRADGTDEGGIERVMERSRKLERAEDPLSKAPAFVRAIDSLPQGLEPRMVLNFNFGALATLSEDAAPRELSDVCRDANEELLRRFESSVIIVSESSERSAFQWRLRLDEPTAEFLGELVSDGFDVSSLVGEKFPLAGSASFGSMAPFVLDADETETLQRISACQNLAGVVASQRLAASDSFVDESEVNAGNVRLMAAMPPVSLLRNGGVPEAIMRMQFEEDADLQAVLDESGSQHSSRETAELVEIDGDEVHVVQNGGGLLGGYEATGGDEFWSGTFAFDSDDIERLSAVSDDGPPLQIAWSPSSMRSLLTAAELSAKASIRLGGTPVPDGGPLSADGMNALVGEMFSALKKIDMISFSVDVDERDVVLEIR